MKKFIIAAVLAAAGMTAAVCGCGGCNQNDPNVFWDEQEGATMYAVYRSPTRFGKYVKLGECDTAEGFYDPDYAFDAYYKIVASGNSGNISEQITGGEAELFGDNTIVLSPDDTPSEVNKFINSVWSDMKPAHFDSARYSFLLKPGIYKDGIDFKIGYYTTIAGLGRTPDEVSISSLSCDDFDGSALINFWRGAENLTVRGDSVWAVSQGSYLRSVNFEGNLDLSTSNPSSGGFIANCDVAGSVNSGSQQQYLARNSKWSSWNGGVWNMVFMGEAAGCAPVDGWEKGAWNTVVESTPVVREKPYLIYEDGSYSVVVPSLRSDSAGLYSAADDSEARVIPLDDFFIAHEGDEAARINGALESGKHLLLTAGVYHTEQPIRITRDDTVVLGTGLATLLPPDGGEAAMICGDADGLTLAGILFDAGNSRTLLEMGTSEEEGADHSDNPSVLSDVFFRIGGVSDESTHADTCLEIRSDDVILDNIWLWRADHGYKWKTDGGGTVQPGVGWDINDGTTGIAVYGDRVKAYGLFAEHFKGHNAYWAGNDGRVVFFQSEIAYDIPQGTTDTGAYEHSSFYVADGVTSFRADGVGIYTHFLCDGVRLDAAMRVPDTQGVSVKNLVAVALSAENSSRLDNAINEVGGQVGGVAGGAFEDRIIRVLLYGGSNA